MNDRDFNNYQRILTGYPPVSFALLGFHLTGTIAGLAGLFTLAQSQPSIKVYWVPALCVLLAFVTLMLGLMWIREHALKDQAVQELRDAGVRFPETAAWTGLVTSMHKLFYVLSFLFWVSLALLKWVNPQWLLSRFGV